MSTNTQPSQDGARRYRQIHETITSLQSIGRGRLVYEGFLHAVAATLASFLVGVVLFMFAPPLLVLRLGLLLVWLATFFGLLWWRWGSRRSLYRDVDTVGQLVESHFGEFRNDITASLQFGRELEELRGENRISSAMIERVLGHTWKKLEAKGGALSEAIPPANIKHAFLTSAVCLVVLTCMIGLAPNATWKSLRAMAFGPVDAMSAPIERNVPIVGDIALLLQFPNYTGLGSQRVLGSTGDIEVIKGTMVKWEGVALVPVDKAELVLKTSSTVENADTVQEGEPTTTPGDRVLLQRRPGRKLVASFSALSSGSYTIEAQQKGGGLVRDGIVRNLRVLNDEMPKIDLHRPEGELDVAPEDAVTFVYDASDDFGLTELAIVTAFAGDEKNKKRTIIRSLDTEAQVLPGDARPTKDEINSRTGLPSMNGEYVLDLQPFGLQPKDRLLVHLEVVDNDTTSGPKVVSSPPVVLRVASPEDKHNEIIESQEKLFEALLDVLADYLESPVGEVYTDPRGKKVEGIPPQWPMATLIERYNSALPPHEKAQGIHSVMKSLLEQMEQDPLMLKRDYELYKRTYNDLVRFQKREKIQLSSLAAPAENETISRTMMRRLFDDRARIIRGTEKAIITLEDLVASQRMEGALETAKQLKEAKERLKELLEQYKKTGDPALKAEIMRQIQRIRERMMEMMNKMKSQLQKLPQEHINLEALEPKEIAEKANDAANSLEDIMKALDRGDIDAAMEMLDKMGQDIDDMLAQMENEFEEMQPEGLSELDKKVSEVMDELNDISTQEQELEKKTSELNEEIKASNEERTQELLDELTRELSQKAQQLREDLNRIDDRMLDGPEQQGVQRVQNSAERLQQALDSKDLGEALEQAQNLRSDIERAERSLDFQRNQMRSNAPRRNSYNKVQRQMQRSTPQAQSLESQIAEAMRQTQPRPSPEQSQRMSRLSKQQGEVRQRTQKLGQKLQGDSEFPMLDEQLGEGLQQAQQFMEGAQRRLGQGKGKRAQESEKLALDKMQQLKQDLRQALKREKMGKQQQGRRNNREKVEIPGQDKDAPRAFREDIMEAMKEDGLRDYSTEIKEYYESLVR